MMDALNILCAVIWLSMLSVMVAGQGEQITQLEHRLSVMEETR